MPWWPSHSVRRIVLRPRKLTATGGRQRLFKGLIFTLTTLVIVTIVGGTRAGRYSFTLVTTQLRLAVLHQIGLEPERAEVEAGHKLIRARTVERTFEALSRFYRDADPRIQAMFRSAGMDPEHALIGSGRVTDGFLISPEVFGLELSGRSYRLLPNRRSVWLRQVTLQNGPFGLFLVPDNHEMRTAAIAAGAIIDERSVQMTNSWGFRGPEPDPDAPVRGVVLGDSFMLGMFNGDQDTPPYRLQLTLESLCGKSVSILNAGHIGYAPEQYYHSLKEYGERFLPHFVVVSVCPNDFGTGGDVLAGHGDDWDEAQFWLGEIASWCRSHSIPCLLVPVPCDVQITGIRRDGRYPARVCDIFTGSPTRYYDPLEEFINEHMRLMREGEKNGEKPRFSPLYNLQISDNHFSPQGAALWARLVATRLDLIMKWPVDTNPIRKPTALDGRATGETRPRGKSAFDACRGVSDGDDFRPIAESKSSAS